MIMNKALSLVGIAVALLGACSGDQRKETLGATGAISPWHSLTEAEVREVAAAVMDSTGIAVNRSAPGIGLPLYVSDNESIENTDLVAWPTIGFHHVPMAEDWPVMPAKVDEIVLMPRNFFDNNPAIDLPN